MSIEKILNNLTPEMAKKESRLIQETVLPQKLQKWVPAYNKVGKRSPYLWLWAYKSIQFINFSSVSPRYQKTVWEIKCLFVMFVTLLDDVGDKMQNKEFLNEILKVPFRQKDISSKKLSSKEKSYLNFTIKLWNFIKMNLSKSPRYAEFEEIFEFDFKQIINIMEFAYLINKKHYLINKTEFFLYFPYNILGILNLTIDTMYSPKLPTAEIGILREIAWRAQKMAQIANWVSTWEREVDENDFTSGIFAYALDLNILPKDNLNKGNKKNIIKKIKNSNIEKNLLKECSFIYADMEKIGKRIKSVSVKQFLSGIEKLIILQLSSRGNY